MDLTWEPARCAWPRCGFVSDSFTVSAPTTLASVTAGLWVNKGSTPTSLQRQIGTTSDGNQIASGTSSLANTFLEPAGGGHNSVNIYESTFAVNGTIGPGPYYLTLQDAQATAGSPVGWDQNNGPSSALVYYTFGSIAPGSESFQVYGSPIPEPSTIIAGALTLLPLGASTVRTLRKKIRA